MRMVLPAVPVWALHGIAVLSLLTALYAAGMALVQIDARRFFAYLFISHSSLVLTGLEIANPIGMTGALCIWLEIGLSLGGLALTLRAVEARIGRISLEQYHGLFDHMPYLGSLFLLTGLAAIGFPGGLSFVGMELLVEGTVEVYPLVGAIIVLATAINGVALLRAYFRIFTGTRHVATVSIAARPSERLVAVTLSLLILGVGMWPSAAIHSRYHAAETLLRIRQESGIDRGSNSFQAQSTSESSEPPQGR
jgi:NADH-quinone oxidoreductase subunit M